MTRELRLRAWDKVSRKMFEVDCVDFKDRTIISKSKQKSFDDVELMQYSGLTDINGENICEGDILKRKIHLTMCGTDLDKWIDEYLSVTYRDEYAGFYIGENRLIAYTNTLFDVDTGCACTEAEIVGNIYTNPELLELNN